MTTDARAPARYEPDDPREWLRRARNDLAFADAIVANVDGFELRCYHAQQAAEKAVKAICIEHAIVFPFTHEIEVLLSVLETNGVAVPDRIRPAELLSRYATSGRYPFGPVVDLAEFETALASAQAVVEWADTQLGTGSKGVREKPARSYPRPRGTDHPAPELLADIVARIVAAAAPERIILFGSGARGTMRPDSDLDLMIVMSQNNDKTDDRRDVDAAIRMALRDLHMGIDIIVATSHDLERYGTSIGLVYRPALEDGRVIYDASKT
ncbi:MAG: HEPN domain-containing protein [Longimicrobiales bacterium]